MKKQKNKQKPKPCCKMMWAYYSPDNYLQVRSIAETKKLSREMISHREWNKNGEKVTYADYEANGYYIRRIFLNYFAI